MGHRKLLHRFHEPGHLHEFTFSCFQRRQLLKNEQWLTWLAETQEEACRAEDVNLVAFVFMPEHVHLLVSPRTDHPQLGRFLARIKQPFSKRVKAALEQTDLNLLRELTIQERPEKICFRFWQEGTGDDRNIVTEEAMHASIDDIHNNPCKRGLCERAVEWKWSSARHLAPPVPVCDDRSPSILRETLGVNWKWAKRPMYQLHPPPQQDPDRPEIHDLREPVMITTPSGTGGASGTHHR